MINISASLLQNDNIGGGLAAALGSTILIVCLGIAVVFIVGLWKVFVKAGQPGWAALVPIYNTYILVKIAGRPGWWLLLFLVPLVNIAIAIVVSIDIAKAFGQSAVFGLLLLFLLSGIGYLVLGFGDYRYIGPMGASAG
jgi:hypothetical protein